MYIPIPELLYSFGCFLLIVSGVICGVVRWFHVCSPCQEAPDHYYPARRLMTFFFFSFALELPYALWPGAQLPWMFVKMFGIVGSPLWLCIVYLRYFHGLNFYGQGPGRFLSWITAVFILTMFVVQVADPTRHLSPGLELAVNIISMLLSVCLTAFMLLVTLNIKRAIDRFHYRNFSQEDDFPYRFAVKVLYVPYAVILAFWLVFISDSRWLNFATNIAGAIIFVAALILILPTHRSAPCADPAGDADGDPSPDSMPGALAVEEVSDVDEEGYADIRQRILDIIDGQRRYLNPQYSLRDLVDEIPNWGRTRISQVCMREFHGFYYLINSRRVAYAQEYAEEHPGAKKQEIAIASGFSSRDTYNHALKSVAKIRESLGKDGD